METKAIKEGMIFSCNDGSTHTITKLDDISVEIDKGAAQIYDFGTNRTVETVVSAIGKGAELIFDPDEADEPNDLNGKETNATNDGETQETPETDAGEENNDNGEKEAMPAEASIVNYEDLAAAYFGKKQKAKGKPKTETADETPAEPEQPEDEPQEEQEPPKTEPGYTGETSDLLTTEDIYALEIGGQVWTEIPHFGSMEKAVFTGVPYNEKTSLVYMMDGYKDENPLQPGRNFNYCGFITDGKFYDDDKTAFEIRQELSADTNVALLEAVPDEETAERNFDKTEPSEWSRKRIKDCKAGDCDTGSAQSYFYKGEEPELTLYNNTQFSDFEIVQYIESPADFVSERCENYRKEHAKDILERYIMYNRTLAAYNAIVNDPANVAHKLKAIADSITDQKTARIELTNGETVRAAAHAIKGIKNGGYISDWYVLAADRDKLPRNEYGNADDIHAEDIVAIYHGQKTLYRAS